MANAEPKENTHARARDFDLWADRNLLRIEFVQNHPGAKPGLVFVLGGLMTRA